jgi:hypothetical protein
VNSFLLALTAFLILVLSALFAAPLFIDWNNYRPAFEMQAKNLLGREVKVDGEVHLVLLPAPELRFDSIKVADEEGSLDRPFLEARSFEAWLNIGALLSGTIEAHKIAIVDPVLRLDVKADGSGNWNDVGRAGVALPFAPKDVMLDEVSVSGGRIEVTKQGVPQFTLEDVAGEASAQSLSGPYKVSATYGYAGRRQELRFSTSAPDAAGLFRIKSALRDLDRNVTYILDGGVSGLGAQPLYEGILVVRAANSVANGEAPEEAQNDAPPADIARRDKALLYELKGPLKATPQRADIPDLDLTVHAKGHPQIFKGSLGLEFGEHIEAKGELVASFVDLDALFAVPGGAQRPSPAAVLYMFAEDLLDGTAELGEGRLAVTVEQAGLGGDLLSAVELALTSKDGAIKIDRLKAMLPGANRIDVSGRLSRGRFGPVFAGPIRLEGSGLRPLTRWAFGDRDVSGQAASGDFTFMANATIGDGALTLADAAGELSGTSFRGALRLQGGERRLIELTLDSERLDLRDVLGDGPLWQSWLPTSAAAAGDKPEETFLGQLRGDDMRVTLRVGELLLPHIPPGKLDARFSLRTDTLDVAQLDFSAAGALTLNGQGRIEQVSEAPSGRVDFALSAVTPESLRIAADLFGLSEEVSRSEHLAGLAPLDMRVGLTATRQNGATQATIALTGKAGGSDVSLLGRADGDPAKPEAASINLYGSVTGERPHAVLVLLFPELPVERLAATGRSKGKLTVKLAGVPNQKITGRAALETDAIGVAFSGQGSLQENGFSFTGQGATVSPDAALALMLVGFEAPPSAAGVPLQLRFGIAKQGPVIDLKDITGMVARESVRGSAQFDLAGPKTRFTLTGNAQYMSLPSLLGVLVAWQRSPSTEEMLGAIGSGASELWPSRGFSLGPIEKAEGSITLEASTLSLGSAVKIRDATLHAAVGKAGLSITDLKGHLFGGELGASGTLSPRGNGAGLEAHAEVKGGELEELAKSVAGSGLAKGSFDLTFDVQGEGLSPPGLVAGLSGEGSLALGPGALQALSSDPLRRVAATAAKKTIKADKHEIEAEAKTVRDKITKGTYKFAAVNVPFEVKNGTLRLTPAVLSGPGAETKVNAYVELASLKLDSEWAVSLAGAAGKDVPPVSLVFTGALNKPSEISPSVDTAAIEAYLTMRRMQEDVERLETLDVSGRTPSPDTEADDEQTSAVPQDEPEPQIDSPAAETTPVQPMAAIEPQPRSQPVPFDEKLPSAMELLGEVEEEEIDVITTLPAPSEMPVPALAPSQTPDTAPPSEAQGAAASETPALTPIPPATPGAPPPAPAEAEAVPQAPAAAAPVPLPDQRPKSDAPETAAAPAAAEAVAPPEPQARPQKPRRQKRAEPPDAWKKGYSIFGGY